MGGFTRSETKVGARLCPRNGNSTTISTDLCSGSSFCSEESGILTLLIGNNDDFGKTEFFTPGWSAMGNALSHNERDVLVEVGRTREGEHHQSSCPSSLKTLLKLADRVGTARLEVFSAE